MFGARVVMSTHSDWNIILERKRFYFDLNNQKPLKLFWNQEKIKEKQFQKKKKIQIFSHFMIFEKLWNFKCNFNHEFLIFFIRFWCKSTLFYSKNLNSQKHFGYQRLQTRYVYLKMWKIAMFIIFWCFSLEIFRIFWRV